MAGTSDTPSDGLQSKPAGISTKIKSLINRKIKGTVSLESQSGQLISPDGTRINVESLPDTVSAHVTESTSGANWCVVAPTVAMEDPDVTVTTHGNQKPVLIASPPSRRAQEQESEEPQHTMDPSHPGPPQTAPTGHENRLRPSHSPQPQQTQPPFIYPAREASVAETESLERPIDNDQCDLVVVRSAENLYRSDWLGILGQEESNIARNYQPILRQEYGGPHYDPDIVLVPRTDPRALPHQNLG